MPGPFGDHQLKIPYEPVADLLAKYARRDPRQDRHRRSGIRHGDRFRPARPDRDRHRGLPQEQRHQQGQPRPAAVRREPGKAPDLARRLAARRRGLPVQSRDQRKADGGADRGARSGADRLSQGDRRRRDGRRRARAAHPLRRLVADRRAADPQDEFFACAAARRRGATARAQRSRRHGLHLLHLGHHGAAEDRRLQPRRLLDERPRHAGIPRADRGRPHAGIPLVRLELGAGR